MKSFALFAASVVGTLAAPTAGIVASSIARADSDFVFHIFAETSDQNYNGRRLATIVPGFKGTEDQLPLIFDANNDHNDFPNVVEAHLDGEALLLTKPVNLDNPTVGVFLNEHTDHNGVTTFAEPLAAGDFSSGGWKINVEQTTHLEYFAPGSVPTQFLVCNRPLQTFTGTQNFDQLVLDFTGGKDTAISDCKKIALRLMAV